MVQAIGIGGGVGISAQALDLAFERGINYYFWGLTFPTYRKMTKWLNSKFKSEREKIIQGPWFISGGSRARLKE